MRRAAHSFLLMTAAVIAASASAAADSKVTPPANLPVSSFRLGELFDGGVHCLR